MRVLQVGAEIFPLVKTGGLADVLGALPQALIAEGADVRLLLPALPAIAEALKPQGRPREIGPAFGAARVTLRRGRLPGSGVVAYLVDAPSLYARSGGPYQDRDGADWADNLQRFALLGWTAAHLASGELDPDWLPQLLHAHDWHAGMACAYAAAHPLAGAACVFTVHNLAHQGLFPGADFGLLGLPSRFMVPSGIEFYGQLSFIKAGLQFAERVTTVSPSYASEIATPEFGCGLDGVIRARGRAVRGILNGVDRVVWDPAADAHLAEGYAPARLAGKTVCRDALRDELGIERRDDAPLFGAVSRLTSQKGLDLLLATLPLLQARGAQLVLLGSGDASLEAAFVAAAAARPGQVAVHIGYDEALAHRIVAGSDALVVPSRFEPCGLTQLYGLRYGSLPVVRRVGGLADTVVDATPEAIREDRATGFVFDMASVAGLDAALARAIDCHAQQTRWQRIMRRAMAQDFSWSDSARQYLRLYRELVGEADRKAGAADFHRDEGSESNEPERL